MEATEIPLTAHIFFSYIWPLGCMDQKVKYNSTERHSADVHEECQRGKKKKRASNSKSGMKGEKSRQEASG